MSNRIMFSVLHSNNGDSKSGILQQSFIFYHFFVEGNGFVKPVHSNDKLYIEKYKKMYTTWVLVIWSWK